MLILEFTYLHKEAFIKTIHSDGVLISLILGDSFLTRNLKPNLEKKKYNAWTFDSDTELVTSSKLRTFQEEGYNFSRSLTVMQNHSDGKIWGMTNHDTAEEHNLKCTSPSRELSFLQNISSEVLFVKVKLGSPWIHVWVLNTFLLQVLR